MNMFDTIVYDIVPIHANSYHESPQNILFEDHNTGNVITELQSNSKRTKWVSFFTLATAISDDGDSNEYLTATQNYEANPDDPDEVYQIPRVLPVLDINAAILPEIAQRFFKLSVLKTLPGNNG